VASKPGMSSSGASAEYVERLFEFEKAVRAELQIPGEIPHPPRPPEWFFRKRT
jgi:hypothetical protein